MRTAIISDIHANLEALEAALADIASQGITDIVCLGDIVGYGPNPNECVELVKKHCRLVLMGNHDAAALDVFSTQNFNINAKIAIEWTSNTLTHESKSFLTNLPMIHIDEAGTYVHATPYEPRMWYYITSLEEAGFNFQFFETPFCFVGHTHIPVAISLVNGHSIEVSQDQIIHYILDGTRRYLFNVGSIGQPRDRNRDSCYAILDAENSLFSLRRVAYDVESCQKKMREVSLPDFLISRLSEGR